jgi:hypothetical protein
MAMLIHELWEDPDGLWTFCPAGPKGKAARDNLPPTSRLVWTVEADSHFAAMTAYYRRQGWGEYSTEHPQDFDSYPDE